MNDILICGLAAGIVTKTLFKHLNGKTDWTVLNCRYCLSHYVGFISLALYTMGKYSPLEFIISWFAVVAVANILLMILDQDCRKLLKESTDLLRKINV